MSHNAYRKPTCGKCGELKPLEYCRPCWKSERASGERVNWNLETRVFELTQENLRLRREMAGIRGEAG